MYYSCSYSPTRDPNDRGNCQLSGPQGYLRAYVGAMASDFGRGYGGEYGFSLVADLAHLKYGVPCEKGAGRNLKTHKSPRSLKIF